MSQTNITASCESMELLAGSLVRIRVQQTQYVIDEQKGSDKTISECIERK